MKDKQQPDSDAISRVAQLLDGMNPEQIKDYASQAATASGVRAKPRAAGANPGMLPKDRPSIPEQLGHLLARLHAHYRNNPEQIHNLPPGLFHQLESYCASHSTTFIPYEIMVENFWPKEGDSMFNLALALQALVTAAKEAQGYGCTVATGAPAPTDLFRALGWLMYNQQKILNLFGWTIDDLMVGNRLELMKIHKEGILK